MAYTKTNWSNNTAPYINETNLNKIEDGIYNNDTAITNLSGKLTSTVSDVLGYDEYSNSSTYAVGDYCIYDNKLYVCNTAIATAEEFNSEHWTETSIDEIISNEVNDAKTNSQLDFIWFSTATGSSSHTVNKTTPYVVATKSANLKKGKYLIITSGAVVSYSTTANQGFINFIEGSTSHQLVSIAQLGSSDGLQGTLQAANILDIEGGDKSYSWSFTVPSDATKTITIKAYQSLWLCAIRIAD